MQVRQKRTRPSPIPPFLKVLIVHNAYQHRGGEDVAVAAETELLRSRGHEVVELTRDNVTLTVASQWQLLRDTLWSSSAATDIVNMVRAHKPHLIHVHNTFPQISPSIYWAADQVKVPVVQTLHNFRFLCAQATFLRDRKICEDCLGTIPWRGVLRKCYRHSTTQSAALVSMLALHRAIGSYRHKVTRYIALSDFSRTRFIQGGLPEDRLRVKPNFATIERRGESERSGALFVGRFSEEKGLQVLIQALQDLPNALCKVIGSGPLESLVLNHPKIRVLGWQSPNDIYEQMHRAAYLVMPSIGYEQFPRTLAEAFGCGLPIIASRLGPLAELIEDGKTGLLFDPGSSEDLARKIQFSDQNPNTLHTMGHNARREYEAKYTAERNYQQLMGIYHEVLIANRRDNLDEPQQL